MKYVYLKKELFKAIVSLVKDINPNWIDKGVKYPKIDLHSWIENTPEDKEQKIREISFIVEAYSNTSYEEAVTMADKVAETIYTTKINITGAEIITALPDGSEEIEEQDNNNIVVYRQLNRITITLKAK